jgi:predicted small secreted protein
MENAMKRLIAIVLTGLFAVGLFGLGGCNTIEGVGKDIKKGGEVIEKTAEKTAEKMKK